MRITAKQIVKTLQQAGYEAVFAGGCVRDEKMHITPHDYDIATSAKPDEIEKLFDKTIAIGKSFGVITVVMDGYNFEVATFRKDSNDSDGRRPNKIEFSSMEEDAKRRDFTINGLFYDPINKKLYDFVGGVQDIKDKTLRFIGEPEDRINEDYLRMMRFVRFSKVLNLFNEENSIDAIKRNAYKIQFISKERIKEEIVKVFKLPVDCSDYIVKLQELNLLNFIIPEYYTMIGNEQSKEYHPEGTVDVHTLKLLKELWDKNYLLKLAGLLHDIGKPFTQKYVNGKITNHGHDQIGVEISRIILERLKFSNDEIGHVLFLIDNHMRLNSVMSISKIRRLKVSPYYDNLIQLAIADVQAASKNFKQLNDFLDKANNLPQEKVLPKCLIDGCDMMGIGFGQDKFLGDTLKKIYNLQLEGVLVDKESQLKFAEKEFINKLAVEFKLCLNC